MVLLLARAFQPSVPFRSWKRLIGRRLPPLAARSLPTDHVAARGRRLELYLPIGDSRKGQRCTELALARPRKRPQLLDVAP